LKILKENATTAAEKKAYDEREQKSREWFGLESSNMIALSNIGSQTFKSMTDGIGKGFAEMLVEGKSWNKSMTALFKDLEIQFISAVVSMAAKWAAFMAMKGIVSIFAAPATGGGSLIGTGLSLPGYDKGWATGGMGMVTRPTTITVGEGGEDEFVSIIPRSQMSSGIQPLTAAMAGAGASGGAAGKGGGGNTYYIGPFIAQGNDNPVDFAQRAMAYILNQTRGRGQVQPKGPSIF
jgi:hypothetical protein